ncbi:MAG: signal peptidase I [Actinobacteria bacterium]|nr:signal peptidase I [Actinomycetota bacterium]
MGILIVYLIACVPLALVYKKANESPVAAFIPIWNTIVLLKIVGKPIWWLLLLLIPIVNLIVVIILYIELAQCFSKGTGFAIGLIFLSWIFLLILGAGDATYRGPAGTAQAA